MIVLFVVRADLRRQRAHELVADPLWIEAPCVPLSNDVSERVHGGDPSTRGAVRVQGFESAAHHNLDLGGTSRRVEHHALRGYQDVRPGVEPFGVTDAASAVAGEEVQELSDRRAQLAPLFVLTGDPRGDQGAQQAESTTDQSADEGGPAGVERHRLVRAA